MILTLPSDFLHWTDIVPPLAESWDTFKVDARGSVGVSPGISEVPECPGVSEAEIEVGGAVEVLEAVENAAVGWAVCRREKAVVR
jgi:hypothetical protein